MNIENQQKNIIQWFNKHKRPWPWRKAKDAYKIWISETMLQQTTSQAVVSFYDNFILKFPTITDLAEAPIEDVYEAWAGLGYYSRARNLHKASQQISKLKAFPRNYEELIEFPGFGPYTARSVSSLAFQKPVGVIDGNVIRVFSRFYGKKYQWWITEDRNQLQKTADFWVKDQHSPTVNQALMELGASICLPKNPKCLICPIRQNCVGLKNNLIDELPLKKPKKPKQIWLWSAEICRKKNQVFIIKNDYAPFLKNQNFLPGSALQKTKKPAKYDYKHMITHHEIYVQVALTPYGQRSNRSQKGQWVEIQHLKKHIPASLIHKAFHVHNMTL